MMMMRSKHARSSKVTVTALLACSVLGPAVSARAAATPQVSIGDVSISGEVAREAAPELGRSLRAALSEELSRASGLDSVKRPLIVSATLTRLFSERRDERAKASASISLVLRRADDQVLFAELRGRASVEETAGNLASLRRAAVQGAVHGALQRLPEAVERSR